MYKQGGNLILLIREFVSIMVSHKLKYIRLEKKGLEVLVEK